MRAAPVQQVTVQPVRPQASQRPLTGCHRAGPRSVLGKHLGDQKNFLASPGDRLGDHLLGIAVHLGCVDMGHAEVEPLSQRGDRGSAAAAADFPGPLTNHRDLARDWTKTTPLHTYPPDSTRLTLPAYGSASPFSSSRTSGCHLVLFKKLGYLVPGNGHLG